MPSILFRNGFVATVDGKFTTIKDGAVAVSDGRIIDVGSTSNLLPKYRNSEFIIDAKGCAILPGLVNSHTHSFQSLLKGVGDDKSLMNWIRDVIYHIGPRMSPGSLELAAELSCVEMIRTGVTSFVDHEDMNTDPGVIDGIASTILRSGLRSFVARGMPLRTERVKRLRIPLAVYKHSEEQHLKIMRSLSNEWKSKGKGRVKICPGPSVIFESTPGLLKEAFSISQENNLPFHIHVAETRDESNSTKEDYGYGEIELLARLGVLNNLTNVVHGIWISDREKKIIARSGASFVHCPVSNMYLASGTVNLRSLIDLGINIALGTDGAASNNSQDMFEVMKFAALLCKQTTSDPSSVTAKQITYMATMGGAKALGQQSAIGSLEKGKSADVILVKLKVAHTAPTYDPISSLVYNSSHNNVKAVVAAGEPLMLESKLTKINEEEVISKAEKFASELLP